MPAATARDPRWSIAVFSSRETAPQLLAAVAACRAASRGSGCVIDVLVNGNERLAKELADELANSPAAQDTPDVRIWHIALGDKAHAWNTYAHDLWQSGDVTFFLDGYVEVREDAFAKLEAALAANPLAMAATGVDRMGRSAARLAEFQAAIAGIHGNLYALRKRAVLNVRSSGFRLPLGIYRTDPTLESCLKFDFDPASGSWNPQRVVVATDVTWNRPVLSPLALSHWQVHWRRMVRQAQGDVEQQALKTFWTVDKKEPGELPRTVQELLGDWIRRFPERWRGMALAKPLRILAVRKACRSQDWSFAERPPELVHGTR